MPELSIIVPVYNVEEYLFKCIDSILAQTFTDFELILIDDGSPDRCGEICDEYAAKDQRIIVIHQQNAGVSAARNAGLDIAQGAYIGFVDSDDVIDASMYQALITAAEHRRQLTFCNVIPFCVEEDLTPANCALPEPQENVSTSALLHDLFSPHSSRTRYSVNKLYQKAYIGDIRFPNGISMWEDLAFLVSVYRSRPSIDCAYVDTPLYCYRTRETSATLASGSYSFKYRNRVFRDNIFLQLPAEDNTVKRDAIYFFIDASLRHLSKCRNDKHAKHHADVFRVKLALFYWLVYGFSHRLMSQTLCHRCIREGLLG